MSMQCTHEGMKYSKWEGDRLTRVRAGTNMYGQEENMEREGESDWEVISQGPKKKRAWGDSNDAEEKKDEEADAEKDGFVDPEQEIAGYDVVADVWREEEERMDELAEIAENEGARFEVDSDGEMWHKYDLRDHGLDMAASALGMQQAEEAIAKRTPGMCAVFFHDACPLYDLTM